LPHLPGPSLPRRLTPGHSIGLRFEDTAQARCRVARRADLRQGGGCVT